MNNNVAVQWSSRLTGVSISAIPQKWPLALTLKNKYIGPRPDVSLNALSSLLLPGSVELQISYFKDLWTSSSVYDLITKNRACQVFEH